MDIKDAIINLEFWADSKGYCVELSRSGSDSVDFESKLISINTSRSLEIQLYTLLHECGHVLSHNNGGVLGTRDVMSEYGEKTRIYRVFTVIEEVEAWKRGLSLAGRLGISVNKKKWDKTIARALKKYMEWCLDFNY